MNEMTPKISVIVPVYKAEAYLHRCVDSLLSQTFQNFEILLVDDGSPDKSGEICDEYARKDTRVRVFHKQNGGVSSARNMGLDNARGEWITFVDSDDYVSKSYLDDFGLGKCNADLYMQGYRQFQEEKIIRQSNFSVTKVQILPFSGCFEEGERLIIINYPWGKLFSHRVIKKNRLTFDLNISYGEDHLFVLSYMNDIQNIAVSPTCSYNYTIGNGENSLSTRINPLKEMLYYVERAYELQMELLQKQDLNHRRMKRCIQNRIYSNWIVTLRSFYKGNTRRFNDFSYMRDVFSRSNCGNEGLLCYQKCLLWIFLHFPTVLSYYILFLYVFIRLK